MYNNDLTTTIIVRQVTGSITTEANTTGYVDIDPPSVDGYHVIAQFCNDTGNGDVFVIGTYTVSGKIRVNCRNISSAQVTNRVSVIVFLEKL